MAANACTQDDGARESLTLIFIKKEKYEKITHRNLTRGERRAVQSTELMKSHFLIDVSFLLFSCLKKGENKEEIRKSSQHFVG
jgi:hypothetical protein